MMRDHKNISEHNLQRGWGWRWGESEVTEPNPPTQELKLTRGRKGNERQAPNDRRSDNTIHWINLYPMDNTISFTITYLLDSDLTIR